MGKKTMIPEARPLSIKLLGYPEVSLGGRPSRFGRKKALALLCYLAAEGGRYPRRELAELLWPGSEKRRARTDLRGVLSGLRKVLGENGTRDNGEGAPTLAIDGELLGVEPRGVELDLRRLEVALSLARAETSEAPPRGQSAEDAAGRGEAIAHLAEALGVYRGEFMEGFSLEDAPEFELWLEAERARWRALFGELCERVSRLQAGAGLPAEAIRTTRLWTRHAPLEEPAHRRLAELLSSSGDSEAALMAYEDFRRALGRGLEIEPSPQMEKLAERLRGEIEGRTSFGSSLARSATASTLSALEVPFAGRREEFGALVSEYHAALAGETRLVALLGEAGIGKTRLGEEFLGWARGRGADTLKGEASEGARLPYGPLIEAIRPRLERERAPDDLLEDIWLSELSRLLPELKERYPDLPPPTSGEGETARGALYEAIARTLGALASRSPAVLFLDDLQWADAATLDVLNYAGRRWAEQGVPVLVLAAARPEDPGDGSERWLSSLERRLTVRRLTLGPLENEDVERLLRKLAGLGLEPATALEKSGAPDGLRSERIGAWLATETGGHPFYLVETLKVLLEKGILVAQARSDGGVVLEINPALQAGGEPSSLVPHSVREVIISRLSRLSPAASDLLAAGAVLGRGFGFEPMVGVAGLGETEGLRGLDELIERRLLVEEGDHQAEERSPLRPDAAYSFSHEKIRQVAYTEGGYARRRVLHRRAFGVLKEGSGASPAGLARHALAGGLAKDGFAYSVAAGDAAAEVFAIGDAISHYEQARELLNVGQRPGRGIEPRIPEVEHLYTQLGRAHETRGEWERARAVYEIMLVRAQETGETRLEVVSLNHLAVFRFQQEGDLPGAKTMLEEARRVAEEASLEEALAETECNLADVAGLWTGDFERSWPPVEKALVSARALERPDLVARALTALTRLKLFAGRLEEAAAHAEEGAALSRKLSSRPAAARTQLPSILAGAAGLSASRRAGNKAMEVQCLVYLAHVRIYQGRLQEGMTIAREARDIAKELPERVETMSLWAIRVGLQEIGEYEEALALARKGTDRAFEARDVYLLGANLGRLGDTYEALQHPEEARAAYEEAVKRGHYGPFSHAGFCVLAAHSGDWQEAYAHAKMAAEVGAFFNPLFSAHLHQEIEALVRGGDERLAREEVRRFAERARTNGRDRMTYLRSLAVFSEREGDAEGAIGQLREAESLAEEIGLPGELWQIRSRIGELHERRQEPERAQDAYARAAQTLRMLARKIGDEKLRKRFLAAPRVRRLLGHD